MTTHIFTTYFNFKNFPKSKSSSTKREREKERNFWCSHEDIFHIVSNECRYSTMSYRMSCKWHILPCHPTALQMKALNSIIIFFSCQRYHDLYSLICLQFCHFLRSQLCIYWLQHIATMLPIVLRIYIDNAIVQPTRKSRSMHCIHGKIYKINVFPIQWCE